MINQQKLNPAESLAQALIEIDWARPEDIEGCSDEDIASLEDRFQITLPASYKAFLRVMGKNAGEFGEDVLWDFWNLAQARGRADEKLIQTKSEFRLPEKAFVFFLQNHEEQGESMLFFDTIGGDDPPVHEYWFDSSQGEASPNAESFSKWVEEYEDFVREYHELREGDG